MSTLEYYRILGIAPGADWEEIQRRYRALAWQYHPDHNPEDPEAAAHFRLVVEAYQAIRRNQARSRTTARNYLRPRFSGKKKIFEEIFGIERPGSPLQQSRGADFRYDLQISFSAAVLGLATEIEVPRLLTCRHCDGSGLAPDSDYQDCPECRGRGCRYGGPGLLRFGPSCRRCRGRGKVPVRNCPHCQGEGHLVQRSRYQIRIPSGTQHGDRLCLKGEGGQGFHHGSPGNLEVVIHVEPHLFFRRVGNDVHCRMPVSFAQAALGGVIRIPAVEGCLELELPRGTQSGRVFRIPGAGTPAGPQRPAGDQVVEVVVTTPEHLSAHQKRLLQEFARLEQGKRVGAGYE